MNFLYETAVNIRKLGAKEIFRKYFFLQETITTVTMLVLFLNTSEGQLKPL